MLKLSNQSIVTKKNFFLLNQKGHFGQKWGGGGGGRSHPTTPPPPPRYGHEPINNEEYSIGPIAIRRYHENINKVVLEAILNLFLGNNIKSEFRKCCRHIGRFYRILNDVR